MGKNILGIGKRILLTGVIACSMMACMAVTSFAYGITGGAFSVTAGNPTVTVPVTGAAGSQITIVVRTAGDAWLTAPNDNVVYIDQLTGTAATTNITFTVDSKFLTDGAEYTVFVGGSGQTVETATLTVGEGGGASTPAVASFTADYDEGFEDFYDGMKLVDLKLASGNGNYTVTFGSMPMFYSTERECYVGLVPAAATAADAVIAEGTPEKFVYGDVDYDEEAEAGEEIDGSDLLSMKMAIRDSSLPTRYPAADVDASGAFDGSDMLAMKMFIAETISAFGATSK